MFAFEALAIGYFTVLAAVALLARVSRPNKWRAALRSLTLAVLILAGTRTLGAGVRVWLGHAYLAFGYWLPAMLASGRHPGAFEAWLVRTDERWQRHKVALPRWVVHGLELSYLLCYPLVPAAFLAIWTYGSEGDIDRFWTAVLAAGLVCYGTLPWLVSRPPRLLDTLPSGRLKPAPATGEVKGLRRVNEFVLRHVSHGLNTFPSGHVAVAVSAALTVLPVSWPAGLVMCAVAASIGAGAIAGRYHYAVDVLWGIVIGGAAALVV